MIKQNENFWNEYYALVDVKDRNKILTLTKKMSESTKPFQTTKLAIRLDI